MTRHCEVARICNSPLARGQREERKTEKGRRRFRMKTRARGKAKGRARKQAARPAGRRSFNLAPHDCMASTPRHRYPPAQMRSFAHDNYSCAVRCDAEVEGLISHSARGAIASERTSSSEAVGIRVLRGPPTKSP
jgi:hypothetical protein